MKRFLLSVLAVFFVCIPSYAQYSVQLDGKPANVYRINNEQRVTLPAAFRVSKDVTSFELHVSRYGRPVITLDFNQTVDGWFLNGDALGFTSDTFGLAFDFATGAVYYLSDDVRKRIEDSLTPKNRLDLKGISTGIPEKQGVRIILVDASVLRRQQLDKFGRVAKTSGDNTGDGADVQVDYAPTSPKIVTNTAGTRGGVVVSGKPVINAAANGQVDQLKKLVASRANINETETETGDNALLKALIAGHDEAAIELVNMGINIKHKNRYGQNALHIAAAGGYYDVSLLLLSKGLKGNDADNAGNTVLMYAAQGPSERLVSLLLQRGASVNIKNKNGSTPLMLAAYSGNNKSVELLMGRGASLSSLDGQRNTALMQAVKGGNAQCVVQLTSNSGFEINVADDLGNTPLHASILTNNNKISELLLARAADVDAKNKDGFTPVMLASKQGNNAILVKLLTKKPDLYLTNNSSMTAYDLAVERGGTVKTTMETAIRRSGEASGGLLNLISANDIAGVTRLIDEGARLNFSSPETGNTPIFTAVTAGHRDMVALLLKHGANPSWQNNNGNTPLLVAVNAGDNRVAKLLIDGKAGVNIRNKNGDTALIWAIKLQRPVMVRDLLSANADPNIRNYKGISPLMVAEGEQLRDIIELLKSFGAF
ncbi:hypothetical protein RsTz2092_01110 [Deferribacterales bacterium RsTz2092]|nr:hypothetical protein AGMMS49941_04550 [Deferribacterales bacterium]